MASDSTRWIAIAALVLSGGVVGVIVGRWTFEPPPAVATPFDTPVRVDLAPLIEEIRRANESVLHAVSDSERSVPVNSTREVAVLDSNALSRLTSTLERTNELLSRAGNGLRGQPSGLEKWKGDGFASIDAMAARMAQFVGSDQWSDVTEEEFRVRHAGWTRDEVLARYGPPKSISANERGVHLNYECRLPSEADPRHVWFFTSEGLLIDSGID
jgi:hypothetical protein